MKIIHDYGSYTTLLLGEHPDFVRAFAQRAVGISIPADKLLVKTEIYYRNASPLRIYLQNWDAPAAC